MSFQSYRNKHHSREVAVMAACLVHRFHGAMLGFAFSRTINILGIAELNEINFIVIGMAALMSGIIHSPLTAIFLIAEITSGYALLVPAHDCLFDYLSDYTILYSSFCIHKKTCVKRRSSRCEQRSCCPESNETFPLCRENFSVMHPDQTLGELVQAI
ncbi:MAG: chloride channel protein, partial [Bacteroidetes bacterium]|nr:chloride channel protein [Bacteroidota bacterium]